ncbi:MAG: ABC transporter permease [Candidatus Odinarchaeota archaeon]|nr:ABC transporter permease [Candidatus Thorarchaeota archaeon]
MNEAKDTPGQVNDSPATSEYQSKIGKFINALIARITSKEFRNQFYWSFGSILLALVVAAVIMLMGGYDPGTAILYLAVGALSQMDQVFWYASPLILTGLSVALAFRCGLFNIGAEGQLYMGAMAAALVAYLFSLPILLHPLLSLLAGVLVGGFWAFVPGLLKAYRGAHEVVTTMMLSYVAILFTSWLVGPNGPYWDGSMVPQTPEFYDSAILPNIFGNYLHFGFIVAILAVFGVDYLINRTVLGYEMRAVGHNIDAAEYAGIDSKKKVAIALGISGGLSGLAGSTEMLGTYHRFIGNWSPGLGWDGITVAVLGNNSPWGVLAGAIFFGALKAGGNTMHAIAHVPIEMVKVIQGLIVLFIAAPRIIQWLINHGNANKEEIVKKPVKAMPNLLGAFFGLASVFLALGIARSIFTMATVSPWTLISALSLFLVAVASVLVFITQYSRDPRCSPLLLLIAVGWSTAAITFLVGSGGLELTSIIMAVIAFVFWIVMYMLGKNTLRDGEGP